MIDNRSNKYSYRGDNHVFAASDRPTVIHCQNDKLIYSNLNEGEVNYIASFDANSYPDSLVLVKPDSLEVGTMDNIQVRQVVVFVFPVHILSTISHNAETSCSKHSPT